MTYGSPQGRYAAEPLLLDFYLSNAPLPELASESDNTSSASWRIRATIDGQSFIFDRWQSLYLRGFEPGVNWIKLEFLDESGEVVGDAINSPVRLVDLEPGGEDSLARLMRGELTLEDARSIVDQGYVKSVSPPLLEPAAAPEPIDTSGKEETEAAVQQAPAPSTMSDDETTLPEEAISIPGETPKEEPEVIEPETTDVKESLTEATEIELDQPVNDSAKEMNAPVETPPSLPERTSSEFSSQQLIERLRRFSQNKAQDKSALQPEEGLITPEFDDVHGQATPPSITPPSEAEVSSEFVPEEPELLVNPE